MVRHRLLLAVAVLGLFTAAAAAGTTECEADSELFGSPWKSGSPYYIQEVAWRAYGSITKVNAYRDASTGCVVGVKATYGWEAMNARRLGVEKVGSENLPSMDLKLQKGEVFNKLQYKADSCITFLSLQTNQGRSLSVGDINSAGELQTSQPQWADGFLAYFKGYTDVPNTSASTGTLQQLQVVWASKSCKQKLKQKGATKAVQDTHSDSAAAEAVRKMKAAYQSGLAADAAAPGNAAFEQGSDAAAAVPPGVTSDTASAAGVTSASDATAAGDSAMDAVELVTPYPEDVTSDTDDGLQAQVQITESLDSDLTDYAQTADDAPSVVLTQAMGAAAVEPTVAAAEGSTGSMTAGNSTTKPFYAGPLPLRKPTDSIPTSTTVVNTTTIITTTTSQKKPGDGQTEYTTQTTTSTVSATTAVCKPTTACIDGKCATSSCAVNGMGKDVATMLCFGTNLVPNPLLELTAGNACANLACKLDKPNCTTAEFGMSGICTGKVVAMGTTAKLHTSGKTFLGYPCMEHRGPMIDLVPVGDYTAKGMYVAKAWKVCDCISGLGLKDGSISFQTPGGGSVTFFPPKFPTIPHFPFLKQPLINMSLPEVVAQWVAANLAEAPVPHAQVNNSVAIQLRKLIPNFTLPSLVLPQISHPFLKVPGNFDFPVFELPFENKAIQKIVTILPDMTSLPTFITPSEPSHIVTIKVPELHLPEITTDKLGLWADSLGVPSMPKLPPVFNMSFSDVLTQWVVANQFSLPVPKFTLPDVNFDSLQKLIPNFQVPSLLLLNVSTPLLKLPEKFPVPVVAIPSDESTITAVGNIIPHLTSLPAMVAPASAKKILAALPNFSLRSLTIPNIGAVAVAAGAAPPKWFNIPKLNLTLPSLQLPKVPEMNLTLPGFTLPSLTLTAPKLNLPLSVPSLSDMTEALQALQGANTSTLPDLIAAWKDNYLSDPLKFDVDGFKNMVATNEQVAPPERVEVSFEVPNVMAQWIAGLVKGAQVPMLEVPGELLNKLQSLLPDLPSKPSLVVMNASLPYYSPDAVQTLDVPTVVVPDSLLSKVTSLLPDLTLVPQILAPREQIQSMQINMPAISLESLAAPSFLHTVSQMMAGLHSKTGGQTSDDQVAVSMVPAAAAAGGTAGAVDYSSGGAGAMSNLGYAPMPDSPTVMVVEPEPMPIDMQAAMNPQPQPGDATAQLAGQTVISPTAAAAANPPQPIIAEQPADINLMTVSVDDGSASEPYNGAPQAQPVVLVTDDATAAADTGGYDSPTWDDSSSSSTSGGSNNVDDVTDPSGMSGDMPESGSATDTVNNQVQLQGYQEDDEGALVIEGFGPETAFMNPKDFYALDKEMQKRFKAMFNL